MSSRLLKLFSQDSSKRLGINGSLTCTKGFAQRIVDQCLISTATRITHLSVGFDHVIVKTNRNPRFAL